MAAIFADVILWCIFLIENYRIMIQFVLELIPKGPTYNNSVLVQVIICRRTCDKPLPEPMLTQIVDAYTRHYGEMN